MSHPTDTRRPLDNESTLQLCKFGSSETVTFTVKSSIGRGGSCLCYEAETVDGGITKKGRLKEVYPADRDGAYFHFKRDPRSGCLIADNEQQIAALDSVIKNTVSAYKKLEGVRSCSSHGTVLNNFVPDAYIFSGKAAGSSLYIWTPSDTYGVTFDEYLQSMDNSTPELAAANLKNIIIAICTLTECICGFHNNDLLHLDIKPGNFLIHKNNVNDVNPHSISMFDVNTVFDMTGDGLYYRDIGTPGFTLMTRSALTNPSPACDIYSIAATLFYALSSDSNGDHYTYESLTGFTMPVSKLKGFQILSAARRKYDSEFIDTLMTIFRKGLSHAVSGSNRYACCEELLEDLRYLNGRLRVDSSQESTAPDEEISVTKKKTLSDAYSKAIIQNLLYTVPLYHYSESSESNILVLGSGAYSCRFVDCCLEAGQMIYMKDDGTYDYKKLNITVVSHCAASDMKNFIRHRPALPDFFNVNGSLENSDQECYGNLRYLNCSDIAPGHSRFVRPSRSSSGAANSALIKAILKDHSNLQYVFISLGDYALNLEVARCVSQHINSGGYPSAVVAFAWDSPGAPEDIFAGMHAVYIPRRASKELLCLDEDLRRMAFNAHLVWNNSTKDFARIERDFLDPYNYESSMAFALSVKYKLHSIGLDMDKYADNTILADAYNENVVTSGDQELFDILVALEHRRWVVEKLTDKWVPPVTIDGQPDLAFCLAGNTKDRENQIHPCIARSRIDSSLTAASLTHAQWDSESFDISRLDPLDQVSVQIHRTFLREQRQRQQVNRLFSLDSLSQTGSIISTCDQVVIDRYNELIFCIQNILDGNARYACFYSDMMKDFVTLIENTPGIPFTDRNFIINSLTLADESLYIISSSLKYEDFKSKDAAIIRQMPYILTYSSRLHLALPLCISADAGSAVTNTDIFRNVAAATLIIPRRISYIYYCENRRAVTRINKVIGYIRNYFAARRLVCSLQFFIAHDGDLSPTDFDQHLSSKKADGIDVDIVCISCSNQVDALRQLCGCLMDVEKDEKPDLFEENDSPLSLSALLSLGLPSYKFDSEKGTFRSCNNCSFVRYITLSSKHALMVDDMFMMKNSGSKKSDVPAYQRHYKNLWSLYRLYPDAWKLLCNSLNTYFAKHDRIVFFKKTEKIELVENRFLIPISQRAVADKLLRELSAPGCGLIESDSALLYYDQSTVEVRLHAHKWFVPIFQEALTKLGGVTSPDLVSVVQTQYNEFSVMLDQLDVTELVIPNLRIDTADKLRQLLIRLREYQESPNPESFHYIDKAPRHDFITITESGEFRSVSVSFRFNSYAIKKLLSTAGRLLEIYTYYKLKECGYFDDIVSSSEINWEQSSVTNELDCLATKGFNAIFIECKSQAELNQDMVNKLYTIVSNFGINVTTVLIADTLRSPDHSDNNANQIVRADKLDVVVISDPREITNIGQTIRNIIEQRINR